MSSTDSCNAIVHAGSAVALKQILLEQLLCSSPASRPRFMFFDLDECLVMPATPFIDGLPGSDALVRRLALCSEQVLAALRQKMVEAYYAAPLTLVDDGLPELIEDLRDRGVIVHGLTSRGMSQTEFAHAWHNRQVVAALESHSIRFSPLAKDNCGEHGDNTKAGGILYAGGQLDKAVIMHQVTHGAPSTLVDNSPNLC